MSVTSDSALKNSCSPFVARSRNWRVVFDKASTKRKGEQYPAPAHASVGDLDSLVKGLVERGITPFAAKEVVAKYPLERIKAQLEIFDWYVASAASRVSGNPAGFLISSIK